MNITKQKLIKKVAMEENIDISLVGKIFNQLETSILSYLSSATPSENVQIKILDGLSIESTYIPEKIINKGMFKNYICNKKIRVKSTVTRYYIEKLNKLIVK